MADYETVLYEEKDHVAWITLNRPESLNSINEQMMDELSEIWLRVKEEPSVRVAVLTGAGERAFSTGVDVRGGSRQGVPKKYGELPEGVSAGSPGFESDMGERIGPKSRLCYKPVIAAVNGMACGGAFYLLGESDIIIASENATFFDPHVTSGIVSGYESIHMLKRMPIGEVIRMQLLGSYERLSAQRAHMLGLVSEVVPQDQLKEAAGWIARAIAAQAPSAIQGTLRAIWAGQDMSRPVALGLSPHFLAMSSRKEAQEAAEARGEERIKWRLR